MTSNDFSFTPSDEISQWVPNDITIPLCGYIDAIEGSKVVSKGKKLLFKVIVNNGKGKRIRVLFWNEKATEFEARIHIHTIIKIQDGISKKANVTFSAYNSGIEDIEISVGSNSIVELYGTYEINKKKKNIEQVEFRHLNQLQESNLFQSEAYIKQTFRTFQYNNGSFGSGVLTDGFFRIRVQVRSFDKEKALQYKEGDHVRIQGTVKMDPGNVVVIYLISFDDMVHTGEEPLTTISLKKGIYALKRKLSIDLDETDSSKPSKMPKIDDLKIVDDE